MLNPTRLPRILLNNWWKQCVLYKLLKILYCCVYSYCAVYLTVCTVAATLDISWSYEFLISNTTPTPSLSLSLSAHHRCWSQCKLHTQVVIYKKSKWKKDKCCMKPLLCLLFHLEILFGKQEWNHFYQREGQNY